MELSIKKFKNIIKGTVNNIFNLEDKLAKERIAICNKCEHKEHYKGFVICNKCGCILNSKIRVPEEHCQKWHR